MVANACTLSSPEYCLPIDMINILKSCRAEQRTVRFHLLRILCACLHVDSMHIILQTYNHTLV